MALFAGCYKLSEQVSWPIFYWLQAWPSWNFCQKASWWNGAAIKVGFFGQRRLLQCAYSQMSTLVFIHLLLSFDDVNEIKGSFLKKKNTEAHFNLVDKVVFFKSTIATPRGQSRKHVRKPARTRDTLLLFLHFNIQIIGMCNIWNRPKDATGNNKKKNIKLLNLFQESELYICC